MNIMLVGCMMVDEYLCADSPGTIESPTGGPEVGCIAYSQAAATVVALHIQPVYRVTQKDNIMIVFHCKSANRAAVVLTESAYITITLACYLIN